MNKSLTAGAWQTRADNISEWLDREAGPELAEQRHLDRASSECAYWHLGYQQALRDILSGLNAADAAHTSDKAN